MEDWDGIVSREGPAVWRTAYRLLGNRADADECFQEVFLGAVRLARQQPLRDPRSILQSMVTARAIDRLRKRYRQRSRETVGDWDDHPAAGATPGQCAEAAELSERLRRRLARIPPKQARAFCLYSLEGASYQEIAEILTTSVDAVGVLLHRARAKLREHLAPVNETQAHPNNRQSQDQQSPNR